MYWKPQNYRVLMADPVGYAKVQGLVYADALGVHIGMTHWVDVTHVLSGRKVAQFRTIAGAARFVEEVARNPAPWRSVDIVNLGAEEVRAIQDWIAKYREQEEVPCRESL